MNIGEPERVSIDGLDCVIRNLRGPDIDNGYLTTLESLSTVEIAADAAKKVLRNMIDGGVHTFVAVHKDEVIGALSLIVEPKMIHSGGLAGRIEDVVTHHDYKGRGVGTHLVQYAMKQAKLAGCYKVTLSCYEDVAQFYERLGFKRHDLGLRVDLQVELSQSDTQ